MTVECRVKFTSLPGDGGAMSLVTKADIGAAKRCYQLILARSGADYYYQLNVDTGTGDHSDYILIRKVLSGAPSLATWYCIRATMQDPSVSRTTGEIFIDGSAQTATVTETGSGTTINNEDAPFLVGATMNSGTPYRFLDGVIDAVVVANTYTATASEPLNVTPSTTYISNMAGLWNFNGSSYADSMPAGNDLTGVNSPTFVDGYPFQL